MKITYIYLVLILFLSCQSERKEEVKSPPLVKTEEPKKEKQLPSAWDQFWIIFQKAVQESDVETIISHTVLPLPGSESISNGKPISEANFKKYFSKLFDAKAIKTFASSTGNLSDFATKSKLVAEQLNIPMNVKVRGLTVLYTFNEGKKNQTESSMTYHFAETSPNMFKLVSIITAG